MEKKNGWKLTFRGVEPIIEIIKERKDKITYSKTNFFQPFRTINKWFYNRSIKKHFKDIGIPINICEGCGDGIVEWIIKNPKNKKLNMFVCNHCVGVYDIYSTKRRIELQYKFDVL